MVEKIASSFGKGTSAETSRSKISELGDKNLKRCNKMPERNTLIYLYIVSQFSVAVYSATLLWEICKQVCTLELSVVCLSR